jgi:hypothetical protein
VSLITVIVQVSKVRSPANFRVLPLNATSIGVTVEAGSAADLTKNLDLSRTLVSAAATSGKERTTSKRLLLAPPPDSLLLKSVIFLQGGGFN